jgi:hypothetical protein
VIIYLPILTLCHDFDVRNPDRVSSYHTGRNVVIVLPPNPYSPLLWLAVLAGGTIEDEIRAKRAIASSNIDLDGKTL